MGTGIQPGMMKYCVVGNIVKERVDESGVLRHGTPAFPGGSKVYISRRFWGNDDVIVLGRNRGGHKYIFESVPLECVENIRFAKVFKPHVLELMADDYEYQDMFWRYKEEDRIGAMNFAEMLNEWKAGNKEKGERYLYEVMTEYGWRPNYGK